jgi:HEAT repeat protein
MANRRTQAWSARLAPAAAHQFAFVAAVSLLKTAGNAIVLARFQAQVLPSMYLSAAMLTAVLGAVAAARRGPPAPPTKAALVGAGLSLVLAGLLWQQVSSAGLALYLFAESFATYAALGFWAQMVALFDPREARRAYTMIAAAGMAGGMAGGVAGHFLANAAGTLPLVLAAAALLGVGAVTFRPPQKGEALSIPLAGTHAPWRDVLDYVRLQPFGRRLGTFVVLLAGMAALADFQFRHRASQVLGENQLAALFSNLHWWVGLACVIFQLALATPLLRRLGVLGYLALVPLLFSVCTGLLFVSDALWPAYVLKFVEMATSLSLLPVAVQLLYAPVPDSLRDGVRGAMDGFIKKSGLALAGVILIALGSTASASMGALALLGLCGLVGWVLVRLKPAYVAALHRRVSPVDASMEAVTVRENLLVEALTHPSPERVLNAVAVMEFQAMDLRPHLEGLLTHPHERVMERAVQLAVTLEAKEVLPRLEALLGSAPRRPRDEAVWAIAKLAPERAAKILPAYIETRDVGFRSAVVAAMLEGPSSYVAEGILQGMAAKAVVGPVAERRAVARILGKVSDARWATSLQTFLEDEDASVRRVAITAAGEGRHVSLAQELLVFLLSREERRHAREALARMGDAATVVLERVMNDRAQPQELRYQLPRVLRQIGTQKAFEALLFSNVRDDAFLHHRIGVALSRFREERPEVSVDEAWVREALDRRFQTHRVLAPVYRDLRAALGDGALLTRAVRDRLEQAFELSFWLLGLLYPAKSLRRVHQQLLGPDSRRRAWALELFDTLVPASDRVQIQTQYALLMDSSTGEAAGLSDALGILCHSDDHVLRACARWQHFKSALKRLPESEDEMAEDRVKKMFALEGVEIFAKSGVDDLAAIAALMREQTFERGDRIFSEGDPGDSLYVIVKGCVEATRAGEHVLTLRDKEAFGDLSLLDGSPRPVDMVAVEQSQVLVIDRGDFLDLMSDRPELLKGVLTALSRQFKTVLDQPRRGSSDSIAR